MANSLVVWSSLLLMTLTCQARAEINGGESIEWMAADADLIVRCRPTEIVDDDPTEGRPWKRIVFEVSATLKGPATPRVTIRDYYRPTGEIATWHAAGGERIVFFIRADRGLEPDDTDGAQRAKYTYRLRQHWQFATDFRDPAKPPMAFTSDLGVLHGEEIEKALRSVIAASPAPATPAIQTQRSESGLQFARGSSVAPDGKSAKLWLPFDSDASRELFSGSATFLVVPFDERLQQLALGWQADRSTRELGLGTLRYFKNDRTIAIFLAALDDRTFQRYGYGGPAMTWRHEMRALAYETLKLWGIDVPRPAIELPADGYRGVPWEALLLLAPPLVLAVLLSRLRRWAFPERQAMARWRIHTILVDASCLTLLLILGAICVAVWQERRVVYEVTFSTAAGRYWSWVDHGGLSLVRAAGWPRPHELSYGVFDRRAAPGERWGAWRLPTITTKQYAGFVWNSGSMQGAISTPSYGGLGKAVPCRALTAPTWALVGAFLIAPLVRFGTVAAQLARRRRRSRKGLCIACGYDLRGGQTRCPECSHSVAQVVAEKP